MGAMPVHSESENPMTNSSSAIARRNPARAVRVGASRALAIVVAVIARPRSGDRSRRGMPPGRRAWACRPGPAGRGGGLGIGREDVPAVAHRVAVLLLAEDLPRLEDAGRWLTGRDRRALVEHPGDLIEVVGHAAAFGSARIAARTQAVASRLRRRNSRRSCDFGPWFVTTVRSSFQSGSA